MTQVMVHADSLEERGMDAQAATEAARTANECLELADHAARWRALCDKVLLPAIPFPVHQLLHETAFHDWDSGLGPAPAWFPTDADLRESNAARFMARHGISSREGLHAWSVRDREAFWTATVEQLAIRFARAPDRIADLSSGPASPRWMPGAKLNIVDSCFLAPAESPAILFRRGPAEPLEKVTVTELESLTNRVANGLARLGLGRGDAIGIDMPMTVESVAAYLGMLKAGCVAISIADSFMPAEIARRLDIGRARAVFTQNVVSRGNEQEPLYEKVKEADAPTAIVVGAADSPGVLRVGDHAWESFLGPDTPFAATPLDPHDHVNILFSSGTTAEPKAIPWAGHTPIKGAADAFFHHDVRPGDVLAWPTNLGWMMGPWLIFASLINRAAMALYYGPPTGREFGELVQDAGVTMLGVVPSLVSAWKRSGCMRGLDWQRIKVFSSTGECSNATDMLYLMSLAGYRPVIEYCGGTEIGGGYITGTVMRPSAPATFSTPALGLDFMILDEQQRPADTGELFLLPPSMGLSTELLNRDHDEVYFSETPHGPGGTPLRRHGDRMERLPGDFYRAHGRADDTMNLAGIKVGAAEIERVVCGVEGIKEAAAIAVARKGGGATQLVIYAVLAPGVAMTKADAMRETRAAIKERFSTAFRVYSVILVDALPRTASNKVMRRELRKQYEEERG